VNRILVTGASGYIGCHLIAELLREDYAVRALVHKSRAIPMGGIESVKGDVCHLAELDQAVRGCNKVVHLACLSMNQSWNDPESDFNVNALGTFNMLKAAQGAGIKQFVYTSTAQVYGPRQNLPISEDDFIRPNSPYAASKLCGEVLCTTFARCYGFGTTVLRLFNVYGAPIDGHDRGTVESIFLERVSKGLAPIIKSLPEEGRDYIHIRDVVRAIRLALQAEAKGEIINIGTGTMTTLLRLAQLISLISYSPKFTHFTKSIKDNILPLCVK